MKKNNLIVVGNDNCFLKVAQIYVNDINDIQLYDKLTLNIENSMMIHSCLVADENIYILDSYNSVLRKYDLRENAISECFTGKDPRHLCKAKDNIYITNFDSDSISIIDYEGCFLIGTITVGMKPHDILVYNDKLYITCYEENCVLEYNISQNSIRHIDVNGKPMHIKRYKDCLYVLSYSVNDEMKTIINQINLATYENKEMFYIDEMTNNFMIDNTLGRLLVLSIENETLYVLDIEKKEKIKQIHFNGYLEDVSADEHFIYIANSDKKIISVLDKYTFELKHQIVLDFIPLYISLAD